MMDKMPFNGFKNGLQRVILFLLLSLTIVFFQGCRTYPAETVMTERMKISFRNEYGTMAVTAGKGLKRFFTWEGDTRDSTMLKRCFSPESERWHGSLGIHQHGRTTFWWPHNGITRCVFEEGQQHFDTLDEAIAWLELPYHSWYVCTSNGLAVGWKKQPKKIWERGAIKKVLRVDVWQIYIGGKELSEYQCDGNVRVWYHPPEELPEILKEVNKKPVYVGGHKPLNLYSSDGNKVQIEYLSKKQMIKEFGLFY